MPILLPCLLISKSQLQGEVREDTFKLGISCRETTHARTKPSRDFCPQTAFVDSVASFTCLSTACVWQGNFGKMTAGVTSVVMRSLSSASVIALITGGSEIGPTAQSIMLKYSTASKFGIAGNVSLWICPLLSAALAFLTRRRPSSRMWSMHPNQGQEQIIHVSEVRA